MKVIRELEQLCTACINHFDDLDLDGRGKIKVFSIELDSHTIWGGNGDRDTDRTYYISKEGWLVRDTVKETGSYQKGDGTVEDKWEKASPIKIEMDINGGKATIFDIMRFLKFYNEIRNKYPKEFMLV